MRCRMLGLIFLVAVAVPPPPAAAAGNIAGDTAAPHSAGFRIDDAQEGFQLVTHGVWSPPPPAAVAEGSSSSSTLVQSKPVRLASQGARNSSFRRAAYLPHVYAAEIQNRLPTGLLDALIWTESRYDPFAVSRAGAAGLGQLMPGTARDLGVNNRFDPRSNVSGAARYLRQMLDRFGLVHLALAAYNAGPGAVERAGRVPRNGETPAYVRRVIEFWGSE